jgi:cytochrome P450
MAHTAESVGQSRPSHVPPELVRPFPYILGRQTTAQPHSFIAAIHEGPAVFWADNAFYGIGGAWVPRRVADLQTVYFDKEHYTARGMAPFASLIGEDWMLLPAEADKPLHALLRGAINPLFTPTRMAALEDKVRGYAREYVQGLRDRGGCEFLRDFCFEFPIKIFLELMGMPQERTAEFLAWENKLLHPADIDETVKTTRSVVAYLRQEIADRRAHPRDDLISFGVQVEIEGRKLTEDELLGFCFNLFLGGLDTVSSALALHFRHLAERHDHQQELRRNPDLIPGAVEEFLRAYAAVATSRNCTKETQLAGVTIRPGDKVLLATYLAGRDPEFYPNPSAVILDRNARHVSFGYGPHLCVGIHLARRELRIAMEEFLAGIPAFNIAPGVEIVSLLAAMIRPFELPLVWKN